MKGPGVLWALVPVWLRLVGLGVVLALLWWLVATILGWREAAAKNGAAVDQANSTAKATTEIAQDLGAAQAERQAVDIHITQDRATFGRQLEELRNENADVRRLGSVPIPQRLRDLAKARRESRDRLGSPEAGGPGADRAEGTRGDD